MTVADYRDLFDQSSTQLNFLLLAQRNMILVFAFIITFISFSYDFQRRFLLRSIAFILLVYCFAIGTVSILDYNAFIEATKREATDKGFQEGLDLLDRWEKWQYFTYVLLILNGFLLIFFILFELNVSKKSKKKSS